MSLRSDRNEWLVHELTKDLIARIEVDVDRLTVEALREAQGPCHTRAAAAAGAVAALNEILAAIYDHPLPKYPQR